MTAPGPAPFQPPATVGELLERCAGRWLSLRTLVTVSHAEEGWDRSESTQLEFSWQPAEDGPELGVLRLHETRQQTGFQLRVAGAARDREGRFEGSDGRRGLWRFDPDHVLHLTWSGGDQQFDERIWFSKANLRLRSRTVSCKNDPSAVQACAFYSEIRRLQR
ncbi:MAG: hypothetical protein TQ37_07890 [Candidatus Synechococcus spongiarum 15L]|uniref:Chromophore lyase CpcS/CpeS n=1 Tax=Candidatus Synechococcus spongiarum 15L TaxID=1608419 RepID=A0A0G8ASP1_9SYNE|nr:MAG: hypothetical protein TQ37_07890 [Candidatus Synechococcus spongiarum 15L]MCY4359929.1 phycobiliprotein lyase [Cyanobacteria bacterium MAG APA_bin_95]